MHIVKRIDKPFPITNPSLQKRISIKRCETVGTPWPEIQQCSI